VQICSASLYAMAILTLAYIALHHSVIIKVGCRYEPAA
jgi:hypothetical protein